MENTKPKEILENIINVMEKTNVDEWEIDKLVVVLNYINELETNRDKALDLLKTLDEDTLSNMQLTSEIIGHIEYILGGEE